MTYANDRPDAIAAMERARTGNYGEDGYNDETYTCPVCGAEDPDKFYIDFCGYCIGCSDCINESDYPDGR